MVRFRFGGSNLSIEEISQLDSNGMQVLYLGGVGKGYVQCTNKDSTKKVCRGEVDGSTSLTNTE